MSRSSLAFFTLLVAACSSEPRAKGPDAADSAVADTKPADVSIDVAKDSPVDTSTGEAAVDADDADVLLADASDAADADAGCFTCPGAPMPTWALEDFQPKSTGYKKTYGLEAFKGKVTVVALLAAW